MRIQGASVNDLARAVEIANQRYAGNLAVHPDAHMIARNSCQARVYVRDSHAAGARLSWTGRHIPAACWHAYRDALRALFAIRPNAVVVTQHARYEGAAGFETAYPETARHNIGSAFSPVTMPELCDCEA